MKKSLFLFVVFLFLFSAPIGNFPLNDDYGFYFTVKQLIEKNEIRIHPSVTASVLFQSFYGYIFASIFGLSHSVLVISTIILAGLAIIGLYLLLKQWLPEEFAILGSFLLLVNPIFFYLAHTFMTDVPALAFMIFSIVAFIKGVKEKKNTYIYVGAIFSVVGFWIRQYAVLPIGGMLLFYLIKKRIKALFKWKTFLFLILFPTANILLWFYIYPIIHGPVVCPYEFAIGPNVAKNITQVVIYSGYFLFPIGGLLLLNWRRLCKIFKKLNKASKFLVLLTATIIFLFLYARVLNNLDINPFFHSLFNTRGLGSFGIMGTKQPLLPYWTWMIFFGLSLATTIGIVTFVFYLLKNTKFLLLFCILVSAVLPMTLYKPFYERYYLITIPLLLPILLTLLKNLKYYRSGLVLSIIVLGMLSWYGYYDNISFNLARWDSINYLLNNGVHEERIDGGFEYNARFFKSCTDPRAVNWHGWGYSLSDEYVISFSELNNYETIRKTNYSGIFGEKLGTIYVLKKINLLIP